MCHFQIIIGLICIKNRLSFYGGKMQRNNFNAKWFISENQANSLAEAMSGIKAIEQEIILPHDAMIHEKRTPDTKNGGQTGYYPGKTYNYRKTFYVPDDWKEKKIVLEFEGIYANSKVFINGEFAGGHPYGYSSLYVNADDFLKYDQDNQIRVTANNGMEQNSRWYSGSGIYRDVNLFIGERLHIPVNGVIITTPDVEEESAMVILDITVKNSGFKRRKVRVVTVITDKTGKLVGKGITPVTMYGEQSEQIRQRLIIENPFLWNCKTPDLYTSNIRIEEEDQVLDVVTENFGIRKLQLDPIHGLRINGEVVKLRGTCIHHDNGILGACTLEQAEERRCRQLIEAGFNCIRSSHHPLSKVMLNACDRLGMLVMDELSDMWNQSKNNNDFSYDFSTWWEKVVEDMVQKDRNHPCVIMYSMGNELPEAGTPKGAQLNRAISNKIKSMDDTRFTTNAINGIMAAGENMGKIFASLMQGNVPEQQDSSMKQEKTGDSGGSNELNSMMSIMLGDLADAIAKHPIMTEVTEEFTEAMDVAGYNYLTGRHEIEHEWYPNRVILGTETFPSDIVRLWSIVKKNNHVIGDMTWTGYDYLGEAGVGVFYYDGTVNFFSKYPDRLASIGDIDIIGNRRPMSYYREIVFGLRKTPYIAVERLNHYGEKSSLTPWMWKDNIASWTWPGYEGKSAIVDVCTDADEVELFLNGVSIAKKPAGEANQFLALFEITYEPGELKAVAYRNGNVCETFSLYTAEEEVELQVHTDRKEIYANGSDLSFLMIRFVDKYGRENLYVQKEITINVEGAGILAGFGSADPSCEGNYDDLTWKTYDGYVLVVIRAGIEPGDIRVTISSENCKTQKVILQAK